MDRVKYWNHILLKLEDQLTKELAKFANMYVFLARFQDDRRIVKLMPAYNRQAALVAMLSEQAEIAWDQCVKADAEVEKVWG